MPHHLAVIFTPTALNVSLQHLLALLQLDLKSNDDYEYAQLSCLINNLWHIEVFLKVGQHLRNMKYGGGNSFRKGLYLNFLFVYLGILMCCLLQYLSTE